MKLLFENWRGYIREIYSPRESVTIATRKELKKYLEQNPEENFTINIDNPVDSYKKFGTGTPHRLPFDYGEWPELINPADDMGWDLIIVPSASGGSHPAQNLKIIGVVEYDGEKAPNKEGNDKMIVAPGRNILDSDKKIIKDFFEKLSDFKKVKWSTK